MIDVFYPLICCLNQLAAKEEAVHDTASLSLISDNIWDRTTQKLIEIQIQYFINHKLANYSVAALKKTFEFVRFFCHFHV